MTHIPNKTLHLLFALLIFSLRVPLLGILFFRTIIGRFFSTVFFSRALLFFIPLILAIPVVHAHCPLCTMGAAAATGVALWFGVKGSVVGIFLGAFAVSIGFVIGKMIKKKYIPHQTFWIIIFSFLTTVLPIMPFLKTGTPVDYYPVLISLAGGYGTLLNKTYLISVPLVITIFGGVVVCLTPLLSRKISDLRSGKIIPFQGTMLTLAILVIAAVGVHYWV